MRKRIIAALLAFLGFLLVFRLGVTEALCAVGDEVRASKKIISVVYDDSGSMDGPRWSYTNYAMQALIALLNEQDELYITFMSDPGNSYRMDTSDLAGAVQEIHDWTESGKTPKKALDTAKSRLSDIKEADAAAQFWLVILTDGEIQDMTTDLQTLLDSYKNSPMSNGTGLNVVYLGMGEAGAANADPAQRLHTYSADSDSEIIKTMQDLANLVSGRLSADKVVASDRKTITVTSKLPLYSFSILSQKSNAKVVDARTKEEKLNIQRNLPLDATNLTEHGESLPNLYGNAAVINKLSDSGEAEVIPPGTYTVTFSSEIELQNLTVQVEPAIGLKAQISRNGVAVDDYSKLENGDTVDIKIVPVIPGTDEVIPDADLPKNISWTVDYEVDGKVLDTGTGKDLKGVTLTKGDNIIRETLHIPGYAPFVNEIYFKLTEVIHVYGVEVVQPSGLSYDRSDMKNLKLDKSNTIRFVLTDEGRPLGKEEQESLGVTLQIDAVSIEPLEDKNLLYTLGQTPAECRLTLNDDGSYSLRPGCGIALPVLALKAGKYTVRVCVSKDTNVTAEGTFTVVPKMEDAKEIPIILAILVLIIYAIIMLLKKRFRDGTLHYECWRIQEDGRGIQQKGMSDSKKINGFTGWLPLPTRASTTTFHGLKLVAGTGGLVIAKGDSIAHSFVGYGTSTNKPERRLKSIETQLHKTKKGDGNREAPDMELSQRYLYLKANDNSRDIWRVWLT